MISTKSMQLLKQFSSRTALIIPMLFSLNACSYFISSATEAFSERLTQAILNHNDPETVASALPAYLLMQEASVIGDTDNESLLLSTANLYGAYLSLLPDDIIRKQRLSQKGLNFALQGLCVHDSKWCDLQQKTYDQVQALLSKTDLDDVDSLYSIASTWSAWIQTNKSDWNAIAQLAQVKLILQRIIELDEGYKQGAAHVYLAVMESLLPESLGGQPELAKQHFERAMQLSPTNLMVQVLYAKHYARLVFDRDLHDKLLKSTLAAQATAPGLTLINTLAQQQARQLLESADDYF